MNVKQTLPVGVQRTELRMHRDERGWLTEVFRDEWRTGIHPVQWNMVYSHPGTLRGFHVHLAHYDYLIVPKGRLILGLKDLRSRSPTFQLSVMLDLSAEHPETVTIPPGVGHGFFFPAESILFYSVSEYWNPDDELGCRWDDPGLGLAWPVTSPLLSERDRTAPSLDELMTLVQKHECPECG